jgi:hypothetical protein
MATNEAEVLEYIESLLSNAFEQLEDYDHVVVSADADVEISLVDSDEKSTPLVVIELVNTVATQNNVKGRIIFADTNFSISVLTARRSEVSYINNKKENIELVKQVLATFANDMNNRFNITEITYNDFQQGDLPIISAVISVTTNIGNFQYELTT